MKTRDLLRRHPPRFIVYDGDYEEVRLDDQCWVAHFRHDDGRHGFALAVPYHGDSKRAAEAFGAICGLLSSHFAVMAERAKKPPTPVGLLEGEIVRGGEAR